MNMQMKVHSMAKRGTTVIKEIQHSLQCYKILFVQTSTNIKVDFCGSRINGFSE